MGGILEELASSNLLAEFVGMFFAALVLGLAMKRKWTEWKTAAAASGCVVAIFVIKVVLAHSSLSFRSVLVTGFPFVAILAWILVAVHFRYSLVSETSAALKASESEVSSLKNTVQQHGTEVDRLVELIHRTTDLLEDTHRLAREAQSLKPVVEQQRVDFDALVQLIGEIQELPGKTGEQGGGLALKEIRNEARISEVDRLLSGTADQIEKLSQRIQFVSEATGNTFILRHKETREILALLGDLVSAVNGIHARSFTEGATQKLAARLVSLKTLIEGQ